jgi:hypothetical protein
MLNTLQEAGELQSDLSISMGPTSMFWVENRRMTLSEGDAGQHLDFKPGAIAPPAEDVERPLEHSTPKMPRIISLV